MFIILVSYRARGIQKFRREELITMIDNVKKYFIKNRIEYKIVISEQNNDNKFNRGMLLNIAFLESEHLFKFSKKYFHMNTDYTINLDREFPNELINFKDGFLDLHRPPYPVLGAACLFDSESYRKINGFPNNLYGWGGDDWAIYHRILSKNIDIYTPCSLFNSGFIIEANYIFDNDVSANHTNINIAKNDNLDINGLNSCQYTIDNFGEFHDGITIFHYLFSFD